MARKGTFYGINGSKVTPPDSLLWSPIVEGTDLAAHQKRSPYYQLTWTKNVVGYSMEEEDTGRLDWFAYDNTTLDELETPIPGATDRSTIYTEAICQSVTSRMTGAAVTQVVATFLVNMDSELPEVAS